MNLRVPGRIQTLHRLVKDLCMPEQKEEIPLPANEPSAQDNSEKNPQKPFKPQRIDVTPDEPMNIGYVGGVFPFKE